MAPTHYGILTTLSEMEFSDAEVTEDNNLVVNGLIGSNTRTTFEEHLQHDTDRVLILDSSGRFIEDAMQMAKLVKKHNLTVLVPRKCLSACVLIANTSKHLIASEGTRFGFHQASMFGDGKSDFSQYWSNIASNQLFDELRKNGVPKRIISEAKRTSANEMDYVSAQQMMEAGLVKELFRALKEMAGASKVKAEVD